MISLFAARRRRLYLPDAVLLSWYWAGSTPLSRTDRTPLSAPVRDVYASNVIRMRPLPDTTWKWNWPSVAFHMSTLPGADAFDSASSNSEDSSPLVAQAVVERVAKERARMVISELMLR